MRLYNIPLGVEDVSYLFKGDKGLDSYIVPREEAKSGGQGSFSTVESPALPTFNIVNLTYGNEVTNQDFNLTESGGMEYVITGLPEGLSNERSFLPSEIPGALPGTGPI